MDNATNPPSSQTIVFRSALGSFIGLAAINLLLTIVTLGIYRFWARTRVRRFLWENTTFAEEPLEYRGKGLELLVGAILGLILIALPYVVVQLVAAALIAAQHPAMAALPGIVLIIGIYYLVGVGLYRSERYILSRTSWRGIRGGMTGGGWAYGWLFFRLQLLRAITVGLASPYISTRLWNARMNDAMFGSTRVEAAAQWRPIFLRFVIALITAVVIYGVAAAYLFGSIAEIATLGKTTPPDIHAILPMLMRLYGTFFVAAILVGLVSLSYHAAYYRQIWGSTRIETLGLEFDATTVNWLTYYLGNLLIIVLTLGLGLAIMPWRAWSFYSSHLRTSGSLDVDALLQTQLAAPTQGEGIADSLGFTLLPF
jgi:uncharacterized membrane protein YjgN (DUF898 family)